MDNTEEKETRAVSIILNAEDQECIDRIAKEYGLIKTTECLRVALRLALKQIDGQQQTCAA
jgi:hypothetical protein